MLTPCEIMEEEGEYKPNVLPSISGVFLFLYISRKGGSVMTTPDAPYPGDQPGTQYTSAGEEVYEFVGADFGVQPPWTKDDLRGHVIVVIGISNDTYESDFGVARSMRYQLTGDDAKTFDVTPTDEPWGFLFSNNAPILEQIRRHEKNGGRLPFTAIFDKVASGSHKGQAYWILKPVTKGRK